MGIYEWFVETKTIKDDRGRERETEKIRLKRIGLILGAILALFILSSSFVTIPAGYRGVMLTWGKATATLGEGLSFKIPIMQEVALMNAQIMKHESVEGAASKDLQEVTTKIAVNYKINSDYALDIYTTLRYDYASRVIEPAIQESVKAATATFTAEELITHRQMVKDKIDQILIDKLDEYHILVTSVSITDFDFSKSFNDAIEAKVTQQQKALEAENKLRQIQAEQQQKIIIAEAERTATITKAEGEARSKVIEAEAFANSTLVKATAEALAQIKLADAQAYQINLINQKIADNPYYIQWSWIQEWDGKLPEWIMGMNDESLQLLLQLPNGVN